MDQEQTQFDITVNADTSAVQSEFKQLEALAGQLGQKLTAAFDSVALKGKRLSDVLRDLGLSLSKMVLQAAFKPLEAGLSNIFSGILRGFADGDHLDRIDTGPYNLIQLGNIGLYGRFPKNLSAGIFIKGTGRRRFFSLLHRAGQAGVGVFIIPVA